MAIGYIANQETALFRFLEDVTIPLDNNVKERALCIIAFGRKNFLFAGYEEGAKNLAILLSIAAFCQLHEINPYEYFRDIIVRIQSHGKRIGDLMPRMWSTKATHTYRHRKWAWAARIHKNLRLRFLGTWFSSAELGFILRSESLRTFRMAMPAQPSAIRTFSDSPLLTIPSTSTFPVSPGSTGRVIRTNSTGFKSTNQPGYCL